MILELGPSYVKRHAFIYNRIRAYNKSLGNRDVMCKIRTVAIYKSTFS